MWGLEGSETGADSPVPPHHWAPTSSNTVVQGDAQNFPSSAPKNISALKGFLTDVQHWKQSHPPRLLGGPLGQLQIGEAHSHAALWDTGLGPGP